jgi:NADP-dependent 3-hydroxy acid dehydrogenase YdfG
MASNCKIAIITGAGSGIGKATALTLLENGYCVALAGRRKESLEELIHEAGNNAFRAIMVPTDVRDTELVKNLFSRTREHFSRVDMLFNNAVGFGPRVDLFNQVIRFILHQRVDSQS